MKHITNATTTTIIKLEFLRDRRNLIAVASGEISQLGGNNSSFKTRNRKATCSCAACVLLFLLAMNLLRLCFCCCKFCCRYYFCCC